MLYSGLQHQFLIDVKNDLLLTMVVSTPVLNQR